MISQKKLLLAVLMIIVAVSLAGWIVLLRGFKIGPDSNTNAANTNISNINTAPNDNVNGQQLNVNNQPIDTSDWQTYRNEELGYIILHPNDWRTESQDGTTLVSCDLEWPKCGWSLTITTTNRDINDFIEEYNKSDLLPNGDALSKIYKQEDLVLNKYQTTKLIGTTALGIDTIFIIVDSVNKKYVLSYNDVEGESRDVGEKIIQTFSIIP